MLEMLIPLFLRKQNKYTIMITKEVDHQTFS